MSSAPRRTDAQRECEDRDAEGDCSSSIRAERRRWRLLRSGARWMSSPKPGPSYCLYLRSVHIDQMRPASAGRIGTVPRPIRFIFTGSLPSASRPNGHEAWSPGRPVHATGRGPAVSLRWAGVGDQQPPAAVGQPPAQLEDGRQRAGPDVGDRPGAGRCASSARMRSPSIATSRSAAREFSIPQSRTWSGSAP